MRSPRHQGGLIDSLVVRLRLDGPPEVASARSANVQAVLSNKALISLAQGSQPDSHPHGPEMFQYLPATAKLLLLTPVMLPIGAENQEGTDWKLSSRSGKAVSPVSTSPRTDPFESLGRALSRRRRSVRHVPFVPKVGFTETHKVFLASADAVVTICTVPEHVNEPKIEQTPLQAILVKQIDFEKAVVSNLSATERKIPHATFTIGAELARIDVPSQSNHIWVGDVYDSEAVEKIVSLLFENDAD